MHFKENVLFFTFPHWSLIEREEGGGEEEEKRGEEGCESQFGYQHGHQVEIKSN